MKKNNETLLKDAIEFAKSYHKDQVDKGGKPYYNHLLGVANNAKEIAKNNGKDDEFILEATLLSYFHDLLEDTTCKIEDISSFISLYQISNEEYFKDGYFQKGLLLLTHNKREEYQLYVGNLLPSEHSSMVKLADMLNNSDISRLNRIPTLEDIERLEKYLCCIEMIQETWGFLKEN